MPAYPALALLLGSAMDTDSPGIRRGTRVLAVISGLVALALIGILAAVRHVPAPGDISEALAHQATYKLSLGHMLDLRLDSFAYLRLPLAMAVVSLCLGAIGTLVLRGQKAFLAAALMMVLFYQAALVAMVQFDPYMSSRALAEALERSPEGTLIVNRHYYPFSSIIFYTNRRALLLNGRAVNLIYGSYAPGTPDVFIDDARFRELWLGAQRYYLAAPEELLPHLSGLVGAEKLIVVKKGGGKILLTNEPLPAGSSQLGKLPETMDVFDQAASSLRRQAHS